MYDENQHNLAVNNFRKNLKLQGLHSDYDIKYVTSLIIENRFDEAEQYISSLEKVYSDIFILNFLKSIFYLKNQEYDQALKQLETINAQDRLFIELKNSLVFWIELELNKKSKDTLVKNFKSGRSPGITLVNQFLASKYIGNKKLHKSYNLQILASDSYIRYKILSAWNLSNEGDTNQALRILKLALIENNQNVLLKQSFKNFKKENYKITSFFNSKNINHNFSEIFYLFSCPCVYSDK